MPLLFAALIACSGVSEPAPAPPAAPDAAPASDPNAGAEGERGHEIFAEGAEAAGNPPFLDVMDELDPAEILDAASWRGCVGITESLMQVFDDGGTVYFGTRDGVVVGTLVNTRGTVRTFDAQGYDLVLDVPGDGTATLAEADEDARSVELRWECNEPPQR